jgi:hypothetical protein
MPAVMRNAIKKSKGRQPSLDAIGKNYSRRKEVRHVDEAKEAKRLKIIHEFHDTERAYVDGLDLIYWVRSRAAEFKLYPLMSYFWLAFSDPGHCFA